MVQVKVTEGILEGEIVQNEYDDGKSFYSFKGIPFAEPPLGDLRFKAPQPPKSWNGVRSAKDFGPICYQVDIFKHSPPQGSEDCLYLNVYSPNLSPQQPLPVMVWIHGGGFVSGSGNDDLYAPEYVVKQGVILVTINYRLEILGFLCLDTEDVPGNAGMKDQVAALRWVNKNIRNFGGNPDNVTIFGESAGGGSVGYHLVSPMTKGLFKRAILQSGAMTCWWAYTTHPTERALALAKKLGYRSENEQDLLNFFKSQPVESLTNHQNRNPITLAAKGKSIFEPGFVIVNEKKFRDNERFFHGDFNGGSMAQNIHEGVEVYLGFTKDEGMIGLIVDYDLEKTIIPQMNTFYEEFVPKPLDYICPIYQQLEIGKKVKEFYFNKKTIGIEDWKQIIKFYSMHYIIYNVVQLAKIIASLGKNKVFLYHFSCVSERNQFANFTKLGSLIGDNTLVSHCDDILYLFSGRLFAEFTKDPEANRLVDMVTKIWTNIAKDGVSPLSRLVVSDDVIEDGEHEEWLTLGLEYSDSQGLCAAGTPNPTSELGIKWSPYTLEKQEYLDIGNELVLGSALYQDEISFWEDIFKKYAPDYVFKS